MDSEPLRSPQTDLDRIRDQQRDTWGRFSSGWQKWDELVLQWLRPYGAAMIRRADLREDSDVLDVASGTGEPGLTAAVLVPRGQVIVTDLTEGMLAVATATAARRGLTNVQTRACDAGALPFADASFDVVLCRFGFMFFPDIIAAAREFARVVRPGGRVCAAVWGAPAKNPWATTVMATIARHVSLPQPPPDSPGLFRCAGTGFLSGVFAEAGLHDIDEEELTGNMTQKSPEHYWDFMTDIAAPVVAGLANVDEATRQRIRADLVESAKQFELNGSICIPSTATVVVGTR